jgi:hypothetical protein
MSRMPEGYSLRERWVGGSRVPTRVRLAQFMANHRGVKTEHVVGHRGHSLNAAADTLASLAWRKLPTAETRMRAEGHARPSWSPGTGSGPQSNKSRCVDAWQVKFDSHMNLQWQGGRA